MIAGWNAPREQVTDENDQIGDDSSLMSASFPSEGKEDNDDSRGDDDDDENNYGDAVDEDKNDAGDHSSSGSDNDDGSLLTPIFPSDPSNGKEDTGDSRGDDDDDENNNGDAVDEDKHDAGDHSSSGSDNEDDGSLLTPVFPSDPSNGKEDNGDSRGDDDDDDDDDENNNGDAVDEDKHDAGNHSSSGSDNDDGSLLTLILPSEGEESNEDSEIELCRNLETNSPDLQSIPLSFDVSASPLSPQNSESTNHPKTDYRSYECLSSPNFFEELSSSDTPVNRDKEFSTGLDGLSTTRRSSQGSSHEISNTFISDLSTSPDLQSLSSESSLHGNTSAFTLYDSSQSRIRARKVEPSLNNSKKRSRKKKTCTYTFCELTVCAGRGGKQFCQTVKANQAFVKAHKTFATYLLELNQNVTMRRDGYTNYWREEIKSYALEMHHQISLGMNWYNFDLWHHNKRYRNTIIFLQQGHN